MHWGRMSGWLISLSIELLFWAVPHLSLHVEPGEGSLAGGTWITIGFDGAESAVLHHANGSQLEISLVNVALATRPKVPCDVSPVFWDLPVVICQTRSLQSEGHAGIYALEVRSEGQVVGQPEPRSCDKCTFKVGCKDGGVCVRLVKAWSIITKEARRRATGLNSPSGRARDDERDRDRHRKAGERVICGQGLTYFFSPLHGGMALLVCFGWSNEIPVHVFSKQFSKAQTPLVYQVNPPSGVPGKLIEVYGWIITGRLEAFDLGEEYLDSPLVLEAQGDKWVTPCSLINRQNGSRYLVQEHGGLGTLQCRVDGDYIGSQNVSFSVFNRGKSMVDKSAWLISAKQDLFLYQTHSEILSVFPETGSLGGRTDITITGDFFHAPVQVTVAGIPCDVSRLSPQEITCSTRAPGKGTRLTAPQAGNRGLLFEVADVSEGLELTEASPGYRWQIVPNASSPLGFWSKEGQPFRARLSGFFVAPEANNYTFWIQADSQASLYFSWSEEPRDKVRVAFIGVGTDDWFDSWEQRGTQEMWQQKSPKMELRGGVKYYLEAQHQGTAPSGGVRVGLQIHNTWLSPDVVATYLHERHQIHARAQRLPEVQMLNVSGQGSFFLSWDNVSSPAVPANATAVQIQSTIEALLAMKCKLEPVSATTLLRLGFEQGLEGSISDGVLTCGAEPFCGRFSLCQPRHLVVTLPEAQKGYQLHQFPYLCMAHKGHTNPVLRMVVTLSVGFQGVPENITCAWSPAPASQDRWQFTCTDLWDVCVPSSWGPQPPTRRVPVLVQQLHLFPGAQETGVLCVDEVMITDTHLTVSQADSGAARPGGGLVEAVSVAGSPPVFEVSIWPVGCGVQLPLLTACSVSAEGVEEGPGLCQAEARRLQGTSPALGGHFHIQLPHTGIPDIAVHLPAPGLRRLLQDNAEGALSSHLQAADFTVEDQDSCYEHVWSLSWPAHSGDLPDVIQVSHGNLTGVNPSVDVRVVYDGGVFLGPIFGDMLATANQQTQVVVEVNDIPAHCAGSCSFQFIQGSTPRVHSVWYSLDGDTNLLVYMTGTGFSATAQALQVMVNGTSCPVVFLNHTNVACRTGLLPIGVHPVSLLVRPLGLAVSASGEGLFLSVGTRLEAVEPSRAAEIGGLWATIRGYSLEGIRLVLFGSRSCIINATASNSRRIQCKVPPRGEDGCTVNVTVVRGAHVAVLARAFTYVPSLNPVVVSLSRNQSSIAGGELLFLGVSLLENHTELEAEVRIQDTLAQICAQTAQGLEVLLPPRPPGLHTISVSINGLSIGSQGVDLRIHYITEVFTRSPCCGSFLVQKDSVREQSPPGRPAWPWGRRLRTSPPSPPFPPPRPRVPPPPCPASPPPRHALGGGGGGAAPGVPGVGLGRAPARRRVPVEVGAGGVRAPRAPPAGEDMDLGFAYYEDNAGATPAGGAGRGRGPGGRATALGPEGPPRAPPRARALTPGPRAAAASVTALTPTLGERGEGAGAGEDCGDPPSSARVHPPCQQSPRAGWRSPDRAEIWSQEKRPRGRRLCPQSTLAARPPRRPLSASPRAPWRSKAWSPDPAVEGLDSKRPVHGEWKVTLLGSAPGWRHMKDNVCYEQMGDFASILEATCEWIRDRQSSLALLCDLWHGTHNCEEAGHTYVQCDLTVTAGTETLPGVWPYLYVCEDCLQDPSVPDGWTAPASPSFSGLFVSPKVERDEILIYNSSCNITMETEAEMECETPNQPITAKITEIQKSWGQNTQEGSAFQFCRRWSRAHSWFSATTPQDGDNVTVEKGQWFLLDTNTSLLNLLHIKGGKLTFLGPGPILLRAHSILISDGGELRIGTEDKPFEGTAQITLHGSSHSTPFYPYGVKFLALRNGTLALHGPLPEVTVTYLRATAPAQHTVLSLENAVDWHGGDEVAIISETGVEELVTVEAVHGAELHLRSPLRYSHNFTEQWVAGERRVLKAMVVLLSRKISIRGNLTKERMELLTSCQEARASQDDLKHCLYSKSEKVLGSRDLGARVIILSSPEGPSLVQMRGVEFQDVGQAFHKHASAITLVGALRGSYIHGCTVRDSFSRGLGMHEAWGLRVDGNVFYKILGHALLVGMYMDIRNPFQEATPGRKCDRSEQGNMITNNVIIGVSGAEGLSSLETLAPSGIYVRSPTNVIERNSVCAAGYGYFFHLVTREAWQAPLLSFTHNRAHSCTRLGLFVYPKFQPPWEHDSAPALFQDFMVWGSAGGAKIFRSSNLHLKNFQVYSCRDFGIDILESDANTSVSDSLLLGHFTGKGNLCMSAGIKTPRRREMMISNTTFINFDLFNCVAIRTCSSCSQGQGGFTVTTNWLTFANSSNLVAFPFPHAAVLEDVDGSLSGKSRSHILASMETLSASCSANASFSQLALGSVCGEDVVFHRMSIGLANAPGVSYDLTLIDSRNKTTRVSYVYDTLSNHYGWMALLLDRETYSLQFESPCVNRSLQYSATFDNFAPGRYLLLEHGELPQHADIEVQCGGHRGRSLPSLPSPGRDRHCDWFFNARQRRLTYLISGQGQVRVLLQVLEGVSPTLSASTSEPDGPLLWSHPETWQDVGEGWGGYNSSLPGPGDDVVIPPNRTVLVDVDLPWLQGLYVMGTLEFPVDRSNELNVACLAILGGELRAGTLDNPLGKGQKLLIHLRASEGVSCDRFYGIRVDPGTIGVYGKVQLHSAYPKKSWTQLGADIAPGNERIIVGEAVDWQPQDKIVLSPSSYEPHEAEVLTVREVRGLHVRTHERLRHRHVGGIHFMEDGRSIRLAVAVGLLTRSIQIRSDTACRGRILVGSFWKTTSEVFSGTLRLLNVEIQNLGAPWSSSVEFTNASGGWLMSCALHRSCGGGVHASGSHGLTLKDNVVFGTAGHGIELEGQAFSLTDNLVALVTQPVWSTTWVAGVKVSRATEVNLHGNVVAGSERLGFHVGGHGCSAQRLWSGNVAHSSLHGLHLYKESTAGGCVGVSGFLAFKNFDYGAMVHAESSVVLDSLVLVDNAIGLLAVACVSSALLSSTSNVQIVVKNSTIVATSSSFDCIQDRAKPRSASATSPQRAPSNPRGGRVGMLWPMFTSEPHRWPLEPWHQVRHGQAVAGLTKLQDVTFSNFVKSCHGEDLDICILPSAMSAGIAHPITAEGTRMLKIKDRNKFYFPPVLPRKDLQRVICPESNCENPRKYLFKDLDGRTLGLPPPVSVFPKIEAEWTGSFFNTEMKADWDLGTWCMFGPIASQSWCSLLTEKWGRS
ncbi:fibrocystin [Thomomys bottae]